MGGGAGRQAQLLRGEAHVAGAPRQGSGAPRQGRGSAGGRAAQAGQQPGLDQFFSSVARPLPAVVHDFGFMRFDPGRLQFMTCTEVPLAPQGATVGLDIRVVGNDSGEKVRCWALLRGRMGWATTWGSKSVGWLVGAPVGGVAGWVLGGQEGQRWATIRKNRCGASVGGFGWPPNAPSPWLAAHSPCCLRLPGLPPDLHSERHAGTARPRCPALQPQGACKQTAGSVHGRVGVCGRREEQGPVHAGVACTSCRRCGAPALLLPPRTSLSSTPSLSPSLCHRGSTISTPFTSRPPLVSAVRRVAQCGVQVRVW